MTTMTMKLCRQNYKIISSLVLQTKFSLRPEHFTSIHLLQVIKFLFKKILLKTLPMVYLLVLVYRIQAQLHTP